MFKNYITTAFRNFKRNKLFSLINISGLAIGISAALIIYLIVQYEFSFEQFRQDKDRIYRITSDLSFTGGERFKNSGVPMPMPKAVRKEVTGIDMLTHFVTANETKVSIPGNGVQPATNFKKQTDIIFADEYYFKLFQQDRIAGASNANLKKPLQVILTESRAKTYFGNLPAAQVLGKQVVYDDSIRTTVIAVVKDLDVSTDFNFKEFISLSTITETALKENYGVGEWGSINSNSQAFVKLMPNISVSQVEKQFPALREKYRTKPEDPNEKDDTKNWLQSLSDLHFASEYDTFGRHQAHKPTLYGLLAVAVFLLLLGSINFINLTTAQSAQRAKEIGVRKTMGSSRKQLMVQFLSETTILTLVATILSIAISPWLLHIFTDFIPKGISFSSINQLHVWVFLLLLVVVVSLLAGVYPALILSRFQPVSVLKNNTNAGGTNSGRVWLRKSLTVTQFVIAQFLVIATLVVSKQIHYSLHKDLGYKKEAIVTFNTRWNFFSDKVDNRRFELLEKLKAIPEINKVCVAGSAPASFSTSSTTLKLEDAGRKVESMVEVKSANADFFSIYGLDIIHGRTLRPSDTALEYVINETYARALGYAKTEDAVGKMIEKNAVTLPIVGIVKDFHTKSTHDAIKPLAFSDNKKNSFTMHLSLKPAGNDPETWKRGLAKIETAYKSLYPEDDFSYAFFDETIASFYESEKQISRLLNWATGLCIFISGLGLLGLVIYSTNQRTKEIGVRKVLGASVMHIISLISADFIRLVFIAFVIAAPIAWWAMNRWLENFAYRTSMSWWIFATCCLGMLIISMFILGIRTFRSATQNPVKSLRTE